MSDRRKIRDSARAVLHDIAQTGTRIDGGCDHCDAYQTVSADPALPGVIKITVHHDDWCPWWTSRKEAS